MCTLMCELTAICGNPKAESGEERWEGGKEEGREGGREGGEKKKQASKKDRAHMTLS